MDDKTLNQISIAVYTGAVKECEDRERDGGLRGNGHHMAQKIQELVMEEVKLRTKNVVTISLGNLVVLMQSAITLLASQRITHEHGAGCFSHTEIREALDAAFTSTENIPPASPTSEFARQGWRDVAKEKGRGKPHAWMF